MKPFQPLMDMLERADDPRGHALRVCKESVEKEPSRTEGTEMVARYNHQAIQNAYNQQWLAAQSGIGRSLGQFGSIFGGR